MTIASEARSELFAALGLPAWQAHNANVHVAVRYAIIPAPPPEYRVQVVESAEILRAVPESYGRQHDELVVEIPSAYYVLAVAAAGANSRANAHGNIPLTYGAWRD